MNLLLKKSIKFSQSTTDFYFNSSIKNLSSIVDKKAAIIITDENVFTAHRQKFKGYNVIVIKPGEEYKIQSTVDSVVETLIEMQADRKSILVGIGGGVITDLTGYVASIYMRGIRFGFVPTTILGLVDASIGGKNGIDVGPYKNLVGIIRQPSFILHDISLLQSLPDNQWENGFAEIIKHACIEDAKMFKDLQKNSITDYQKNLDKLNTLIMRNAMIKIKVVHKDEFENGNRRLLNFGHTIGHALETQYDLLHGQAIAIGMTYACEMSEQLLGFSETDSVVNVFTAYGLLSYATFDADKVFNILSMDKKREKNEMNFVLLQNIGVGRVVALRLTNLKKMLKQFQS